VSVCIRSQPGTHRFEQHQRDAVLAWELVHLAGVDSQVAGFSSKRSLDGIVVLSGFLDRHPNIKMTSSSPARPGFVCPRCLHAAFKRYAAERTTSERSRARRSSSSARSRSSQTRHWY